MANKVDIRKLIKKKYGEDTLELPDLLEEIDLVLSEMYDYGSKHDTTDILPISEDPKQAIRIANAVNGNSVPLEPEVGAPRNPRPDSDQERWYHADKIAEAGQAIKNMEPVTVTVPDLFSLVSNQNMELGSPERKMINDIISNFKYGNWIDKVKELQKFINDPIQLEGSGKDMGMRKAISSLMYISLLKKISFFIAQPGKLFEYIIAPLIGPDAKVVGSTDQDIIDITRETGYGYSVKFFTGKTSSFQVKGSYENLQKVVAKDPTKAITYIIAASNVQEKSLELAELNITSNQDYFKSYKAVAEYFGGTLYQNNTNPGVFGLYILSEEGKNNKKRDFELVKAARSQAAAAEKSQRAAEKAAQRTQPKLEPQDSVSFDSKQFTVAQLKDINKQLQTQFSNIPQNIFQKEIEKRLNNAKISGNFPDSLKQEIASQKDPESLKTFVRAYQAKVEQTLEAAEQQKIARAVQTQAEQPVQQQQLDELLYEVEGETEPNIEEPENKQKKYEFNIPLKGQWAKFTKIELKFADVKTYNQFSLKLCTDLQVSMANTLNAFSQLGINLTKYLGTARPEEGQKENYAQLCIENTVVIEENIMNIAGQEGDKITKKK